MELLKNNRPKIIRTKLLRLIGKKMITLPWGVYAAPSADIREIDVTHESIHIAQYRELLVASLVLTIPMAVVSVWWAPLISLVIFYLWYGSEYLIRYVVYGFDQRRAYKNISFELEAYDNDDNSSYLDDRKWFAFLNYILR